MSEGGFSDEFEEELLTRMFVPDAPWPVGAKPGDVRLWVRDDWWGPARLVKTWRGVRFALDGDAVVSVDPLILTSFDLSAVPSDARWTFHRPWEDRWIAWGKIDLPDRPPGGGETVPLDIRFSAA